MNKMIVGHFSQCLIKIVDCYVINIVYGLGLFFNVRGRCK